ncbi:hypothetical protein D918_06581 [Trichuris suis]|nr:hypothetical protein D918_06581 [Trichuris suis]
MDFDSQKECLEFEGRLLEAKQVGFATASQLKVYKKGKLKKTINLDECYGMESAAGNCLPELHPFAVELHGKPAKAVIGSKC